MKKIILISILLLSVVSVLAALIDVGIIPTPKTFTTSLNATEKTTLKADNFNPYWNGTVINDNGVYYGYFFLGNGETPFKVRLFNNAEREKYYSYADGEQRLTTPLTLEELIEDRMIYQQDNILKREYKKRVDNKVFIDVGVKTVSLK